MRDSLIPGNPLEESWTGTFAIGNFDAFCNARVELILDRIREVVGDSLVITQGIYQDEIEDE